MPFVYRPPLGEKAMQTINVLGVEITAEPLDGVHLAIRIALENEDRAARYVCATSVHGVIEAQSDPSLKQILNAAFVNHADGMPLMKVGRLRGARDIQRIRGADMFDQVCRMTADMPVGHFFYGGAPGVAEALGREMAARYPGLRVAGSYCPPFRPLTSDEKEEIAAAINGSGADIVWVGLSTPKQEKWIGEMRDSLDVKLLFSIGAAFDFHTGRAVEAPRWISNTGLEWLFRLLTEPRRLWRRYFKIVPMFIALAAMQLLRIRSYE